MGDCRLHISVDGDLLQTNDIRVNRVFSADTTVREVLEEVLLPLCWKHPLASNEDAALFPREACLWDCTLHPPRDISDWPLKLFPNKTGPKSKTLYDAGWFPSGTLQVLPSGTAPSMAASDIYDDVQYNQPTQIISTLPSSRVRLANEGSDNAMPSQVLQSVTTRFQGDDQEQSGNALEVRKQNRVARQLKELERNRRLEERIRELEKSTNKNKKTSQLVRNMLIKSRCTGSKYLDERDRVYLHCVVVSGDSTATEYRYFSQQDTVAKVVSSLETSSSSTDAELLVRTGASEYRRLPTTMRLYEALSQQHLKQVDSIVIRRYSAGSDEPTTSVLEDTVAMEEEVFERNNTCETDNTDAQENTTTKVCVTEDTKGDGMHYERLREMLKAMDEAEAKKTRGKKKSKTSDTVRAMLIKGRAKGDTKRVPRMDDRFFVELVVVQETGDKMVPKQSFVFLAKTDPVGRLMRDCVPESKGMESMVLHPSEDGIFCKVSLDLTWQEVQDKGVIKPFDRVVVWLYKT